MYLSLSMLLVFAFSLSQVQAQKSKEPIQSSLVINPLDIVISDTTRIVEDAPLDIGQNRGLFIRTPDNKMQLRILGSVRYLVVFDNQDLTDKNSFKTYDIPTGLLDQSLPNYYNGLSQTRLGFEVTRKTDDEDIFIRLETDFAGPNGFRIRHAYGQYKRFLFGQTWSLFSHINALPAMVDFAGPTASIITRNPQIRYSISDVTKDINLSFSAEYIVPNVELPDTTVSETFQLIPDLAVRLDKVFPWGSAQVSAILPILSGRDNQNELILRTGWGLSSSVVINSWKNGKWYFQGVMGRAISRYFNDLSDNGLDLVLSPEGQTFTPLTYGFYGTYEHAWNDDIFSNFTYGWLLVEQFSFNPPMAYKEGHSLRMNTFFDVTEGAKVGVEGIYGDRIDYDQQKGNVIRVNLLFYYDF